MQFSSIWPIRRILFGAATLAQSGSGSDGNKGLLCIPQNSSITGTSPSDCLVSYLGYSFAGGGGLTPQQRCSQCILQPQSTGQLLTIVQQLANHNMQNSSRIMHMHSRGILFIDIWLWWKQLKLPKNAYVYTYKYAYMCACVCVCVYIYILVFLSKRSEEVLLIFFRVFGNFKNA